MAGISSDDDTAPPRRAVPAAVKPVSRVRMPAAQRREQLIAIGRQLFAERGFDATSIEEVASRARVSKPVVYEHFGGKEGLYAVVVDREVRALLDRITTALTAGHPRELLEQAALALLSAVNAQELIIGQSLGTLGSASKSIDFLSSFAKTLQDAVTEGLGSLVDADLAKESALLQALQVKQQLGISALSIANQRPQTLLALFQ